MYHSRARLASASARYDAIVHLSRVRSLLKFKKLALSPPINQVLRSLRARLLRPDLPYALRYHSSYPPVDGGLVVSSRDHVLESDRGLQGIALSMTYEASFDTQEQRTHEAAEEMKRRMRIIDKETRARRSCGDASVAALVRFVKDCGMVDVSAEFM